MKNTQLQEFIRPAKCIKAVEALKACGNKFYQNVDLDRNFMDKEDEKFLNEAIDIFEAGRNPEVPNKNNENFEADHDDKELDPNLQDNEDENETTLDAVKKFQARQEDHTCLMPQDLAALVVVNKKDIPLTITNEDTNETMKFAPGEGKIPTNPLKEENLDVKANPRHHPTGRFGLNYEREFPLSPSQYFNQRLMNVDERFSRDHYYLFFAASFVEVHGIERQINLSGVKGNLHFFKVM